MLRTAELCRICSNRTVHLNCGLTFHLFKIIINSYLFIDALADLLTSTSMMGIALPTLFVIALLCGALGFIIVRHRRLQNSFTSFANSHYSTRSGAATFTGTDGLGKLQQRLCL